MKRYFPFSQYLKKRFGRRVHKVSIDAGFSCPNIDGTKAVGGCSYCNNEGFNFSSRVAPRPISEQIERCVDFIQTRYKAGAFMAYFQAHTNTFAPIPELKAAYSQPLGYPGFVGMSVGTRPDSVSPAILDLLESYRAHYDEVWVEYGLQTTHNRTLERINRQDTYERFLWAVDETARRDLKICVHVILGLPGETRGDMMQTAARLMALPYHSVKVHLMHVIKNTRMAEEYRRGEIAVFEMDEYVQTVCDFLERIPRDISVQRLTADAPPDILIAPQWCLERNAIYAMIDGEMERRGAWQGCRVPAAVYEARWKRMGVPVAHQDYAWSKERTGSCG